MHFQELSTQSTMFLWKLKSTAFSIWSYRLLTGPEQPDGLTHSPETRWKMWPQTSEELQVQADRSWAQQQSVSVCPQSLWLLNECVCVCVLFSSPSPSGTCPNIYSSFLWCYLDSKHVSVWRECVWLQKLVHLLPPRPQAFRCAHATHTHTHTHIHHTHAHTHTYTTHARTHTHTHAHTYTHTHAYTYSTRTHTHAHTHTHTLSHTRTHTRTCCHLSISWENPKIED